MRMKREERSVTREERMRRETLEQESSSRKEKRIIGGKNGKHHSRESMRK